MRLEGYDRCGNILDSDFNRILIYDDYDHPVCLIVKTGHGAAYIGIRGDKDFEDQMAALGFDDVKIVRKTTSQLNLLKDEE